MASCAENKNDVTSGVPPQEFERGNPLLTLLVLSASPQFFCEKIDILGFVVSAEGVAPLRPLGLSGSPESDPPPPLPLPQVFSPFPPICLSTIQLLGSFPPLGLSGPPQVLDRGKPLKLPPLPKLGLSCLSEGIPAKLPSLTTNILSPQTSRSCRTFSQSDSLLHHNKHTHTHTHTRLTPQTRLHRKILPTSDRSSEFDRRHTLGVR